MELWIRVQKNKDLKEGLVKVDDLMVDTDSDGKWCMYQSCDTLGIYKTEQRALEVLDEIQAVIMVNGLLPCELKQELNKRNIDLNDRAIFNIKTNTCLYIMPQE